MNALQAALQRVRDLALASAAGMQVVREVVADHEAEIVDMQLEQLLSGKNAEGEDITPLYKSPDYAAYKQHVNPKPAYRVPDMKATGDYHESIKAEVKGKQIQIIATDHKAGKLERKYGPLLGLTPENRERLKGEILRPYIFDKMRERLLAKLR